MNLGNIWVRLGLKGREGFDAELRKAEASAKSGFKGMAKASEAFTTSLKGMSKLLVGVSLSMFVRDAVRTAAASKDAGTEVKEFVSNLEQLKIKIGLVLLSIGESGLGGALRNMLETFTWLNAVMSKGPELRGTREMREEVEKIIELQKKINELPKPGYPGFAGLSKYSTPEDQQAFYQSRMDDLETELAEAQDKLRLAERKWQMGRAAAAPARTPGGIEPAAPARTPGGIEPAAGHGWWDSQFVYKEYMDDVRRESDELARIKKEGLEEETQLTKDALDEQKRLRDEFNDKIEAQWGELVGDPLQETFNAMIYGGLKVDNAFKHLIKSMYQQILWLMSQKLVLAFMDMLTGTGSGPVGWLEKIFTGGGAKGGGAGPVGLQGHGSGGGPRVQVFVDGREVAARVRSWDGFEERRGI